MGWSSGVTDGGLGEWQDGTGEFSSRFCRRCGFGGDVWVRGQ